MISTDSSKIAKLAKKNKINVPFLRPKKLSNYNSSVYDVIKHARKYFNKIDKFNYLVLLQPTSPFRNSKHIDLAIKKFSNIPLKDRKSLISVNKSQKINAWIMKKKNKLLSLIINKSKKIINRQDSPELYLPNGGIYICNLKYYRDNFFSNKIAFFLMNKISSLDINDKDDFNLAKKNSKFLN